MSYTFPLKRYLRTVWLPNFAAQPLDHVPGDVRILPNGCALPWPRYEWLRLAPEDCTLRWIDIKGARFEEAAAQYMKDAPDILLKVETGSDSGNLKLPDETLVELSEADLAELARPVSTKEDLTFLLRYFVFSTVSEVLRILGVSHLPLDNEQTEFQPLDILPSHETAKWTLLHLPRADGESSSIIIVTIPPWDFGPQDLRGVFDYRLQSEPMFSNNPPKDNAEILWAVILQACKARTCHYFVVNTWYNWIFGSLSPNYIAAQMTATTFAPIRLREDVDFYYSDLEPEQSKRPRFMERLLYWVQVSRGHALGSLPTDVVPKIDPLIQYL